MSIFTLSPSQIIELLLIFARVAAMMSTAPIFGSPRVPLPLRAGLSLLLALLLQPLVASDVHGVASTGIFLLLAAREVIVGLIIGYVASLIFSMVEMAGELLDTQAGFSFAGTVNPSMERPSAILGQFQMVLMWLIFLAVNGHLILMQAIADSFAIVPLGEFAYTGEMTGSLLRMVMTIMVIAIKVSAPVLAAVLLADLALGILQRTMPQLNIIAVGFPVRITVALVVMGLSLPFIVASHRSAVPWMETSMRTIFGW